MFGTNKNRGNEGGKTLKRLYVIFTRWRWLKKQN